jgi:hypothetical protein
MLSWITNAFSPVVVGYIKENGSPNEIPAAASVALDWMQE